MYTKLAPCFCLFVFPVSQGDQSSQSKMLHTEKKRTNVQLHINRRQNFGCECEKERTNERRARLKKNKELHIKCL